MGDGQSCRHGLWKGGRAYGDVDVVVEADDVAPLALEQLDVTDHQQRTTRHGGQPGDTKRGGGVREGG